MSLDTPTRAAEEFAGSIKDFDRGAASEMVRAYRQAYNEAKQRLASFVARYEAARKELDDRMMRGDLSMAERNRLVSEVMGTEFQSRRWAEVATGIQRTMAEYARVAEGITTDAQGKAIRMGSRDMGALIEDQMPDSLGFSYSRPDDGALRAMVGFTQPGAPLSNLFAKIAPEMMGMARDTLLRGIGLGTNPAVLARQLDGPLGIPLWRSLTIARTETLRAYRESQRQTVISNADVLDGWVWRSARDRRTCEVCWANDGKVFPIEFTDKHFSDSDYDALMGASDEEVEAALSPVAVADVMDAHVNCRCTMVPRAKSYAELLDDPALPDTRPDMGTGPDAFARLDPAVQAQILGPGKYALYQRGLPLDAMWRTTTSEWGTSRVAKSLTQIRQEIDAGLLVLRPVERSYADILRDDYGIPYTDSAWFPEENRQAIIDALSNMKRNGVTFAPGEGPSVLFREDLGAHPLNKGGRVPAHYDPSGESVVVSRYGFEALRWQNYGIYSDEGANGFQALMEHEFGHAVFHKGLSASAQTEWQRIFDNTGKTNTDLTRAINSTIQKRADARRRVARWQAETDLTPDFVARQLETWTELEKRYSSSLDALRAMKAGQGQNRDLHPSSYGRHNFKEDFAETFWRWLNTPNWLRIHAPARYAFMEKNFPK